MNNIQISFNNKEFLEKKILICAPCDLYQALSLFVNQAVEEKLKLWDISITPTEVEYFMGDEI
tara:strand:+ start:554 stop:742 length:189 start_codon:yes stop_codon:yes gene_type:complete